MAVGSGSYNTCVVRRNGALVCWGYWTGNTAGSFAPMEIPGLSDVFATLSGDYHTCAVRRDGTTACWGGNYSLQRGDNDRNSDGYPRAVAGISDAIAVAAASAHTCALRSDHTVACWGRNYEGELGVDTALGESASPVALPGLTDVIALAAGEIHTCALRSTGDVYCWGYNGDGELGNGSVNYDPNPTPTAVVGLSDAVSITASSADTCARRSNGTVVCWGGNYYGQHGDGTTTSHFFPRRRSASTTPST